MVKSTKNTESEKKKSTREDYSSAASNNNNVFFEQAQKMQEQMKKINPFGEEAEKMAGKFSSDASNGFNKSKIFEMHKKNMEALNEANVMAVSVMKQISQLQGQFMEQTFKEIDEIVQENMNFKQTGVEESFMKNAQHMKKAVDRAVQHSASVSQIMLKSNQDLFKNVQNRFEEGMREMNENINKTKH